MSEDKICLKLVEYINEFQSQILTLYEKSDLCLDEIAETLLIYEDTQALLRYIPYINDKTLSRLEYLLERAESMHENPESERLFKEYNLWFDFIVRMTDAQETELFGKLPKINGFPEDELDMFIQDLRRRWSDIFILPKPGDIKFPKMEAERKRNSRNANLQYNWAKMNEYERGAIVNYIVRETGIDLCDTLKVLSHIEGALGSVEEWFRVHADQINMISSNRDYRLLDILSGLYKQYFQKAPSHNPTGPFAMLVETVLDAKGPEYDSERAIRGIQNYLKQDRKHINLFCSQSPYPGFEHIFLE